ncbi:Alpha,alpha-trehalose phosphorylase [Saliniradius amylolyticus]|uniref:Alpha,alpha-trehalose phosphorylase n=1 Tax=Saliniradius amylolyticus TaxID=2183582 RepID=A0A2S2E6V4_9ALTE|nr:glycosyl hydrolase family 65 protein [Saliniradius amylolyticus]AWL12970.1 Alpha,alpha-trehalose phosphorylase [Saliniradius amylolyticus]
MINATHSPKFAVEPWHLTSKQQQSGNPQLEETLFALANGYIGSRGTDTQAPEAGQPHCEGTYLNGVYSREPIQYGEKAYGYASHNDKILQVPNGKRLDIWVDGQPLTTANAIADEQRLDMSDATLTRTTQWTLTNGHSLTLTCQRLVSLAESQLMVQRLEFNYQGPSVTLEVRSLLDADYGVKFDSDDPRAGQLNMAENLTLQDSQVDDTRTWMRHRVNHTPFIIDSATALHFSRPPEQSEVQQLPAQVGQTLRFHLDGKPLILEKHVAYRHQGPGDQGLSEVEQVLDKALRLGWEGAYQDHQRQAEAFWHSSQVSIDGDDALEQGLRFNMLHLFMSTGRSGFNNIGAKGLTGHGYDGHYFWDTEIYILAFLTHTNPELAKQCLKYRYHYLDGARQRARTMSHKRGALFPWRTIGGDECSAYYPAGTAQYHINAAIAFGVKRYLDNTHDWGFIRENGAELVFETARLWLDLGHFNPARQDLFCIDEVTGPDEYSALVNNNFYTNAMAQAHLRFAVQIAHHLSQHYQEDWQRLVSELGLEAREVDLWHDAAEAMYLPYDESRGISKQDDLFLERERWDFANTPADHYPLLLHYHPLVLYRHQVLKQADVILAMFLLDDRFDPALKQRNLDYYEPLTTHDSTLSSCIHSIAFAELGQLQRAYEFYHDTVRMDIDNRHANTEYGIHTACMAGSWMGIVNGFAGLRIRHDGPYLSPRLPEQWQGYQFRFRYLDCLLEVKVTARNTTYTLLEGEAMTLHHYDQSLSLVPNRPNQIA